MRKLGEVMGYIWEKSRGERIGVIWVQAQDRDVPSSPSGLTIIIDIF